MEYPLQERVLAFC